MHSTDIYHTVTNTIIDLLENHQITYDRPWIGLDVDNEFAHNPKTCAYYRGINQFLLSYTMMKSGYLKNQWATFNQIKSMGGTVIKGQKSTPVIFYKPTYKDKNNRYYSSDTIQTVSKQNYKDLGIQFIPVIKMYRVFNLQAQTQNLSSDIYNVAPKGELKDFEKDEAAENLLTHSGATIIEKEGNEAFYDRVSDTITLPNRNQFKGIKENFYSVALHELGHWTGGSKRFNRNFGRFGDEIYAQEELIAELISAFCCAHLGFTKTITNNASYIKSWLSILHKDSKAIISAAALAQKGADLILNPKPSEVHSYDTV